MNLRTPIKHALLASTMALVATWGFSLSAFADGADGETVISSSPASRPIDARHESEELNARDTRITGLLTVPIRYFLDRRERGALQREQLMQLDGTHSLESEAYRRHMQIDASERIGAHEPVFESREDRAAATLYDSGNLLRVRF